MLQDKSCTDLRRLFSPGGNNSTPVMQEWYADVHASHRIRSFVGHHPSHVIFMSMPRNRECRRAATHVFSAQYSCKREQTTFIPKEILVGYSTLIPPPLLFTCILYCTKITARERSFCSSGWGPWYIVTDQYEASLFMRVSCSYTYYTFMCPNCCFQTFGFQSHLLFSCSSSASNSMGLLRLPVLSPGVIFWQSVHSLLPVAFLPNASAAKTVHPPPARALVHGTDRCHNRVCRFFAWLRARR